MTGGLRYLPDGPGQVPGVVMSHGFSAVKEMGLPPFAEAIGDAGVAVLLHDHRGLGASDGERLGLWGSSFSGGEVLVLGAVDDRVRAVVANMPFAGLPGADDGADPDAAVAAISAELAGGPLALGTDASVYGPMAVVDEPGNEMSAFLGQPESSEWFLAAGAGTTWRNEVTPANAFGTEPPFDPGVCAARLHCPTLFVVASNDQVAVTGLALAAYERAPEPQRLLMIEGHHFTPYSGPPQAEAAAAAASWFATHLSG